jgi:hypothetical protein
MGLLSSTFAVWRNALRQSATWSGLVWSFVFGVVLAVIMIGVGWREFASSFAHSPSGLAPLIATLAGHALAGILLLFLIMLVVGPFVMAGQYGLYGRAVAGEAVNWSTFWRLGGRYYGRAWGFTLFTAIYGLVSYAVLTPLLVRLHTAGIVVMAVAFILTWPFLIRMMGGLFVRVMPWGKSFRATFRGAGYWALLGGNLLALLADGALVGLGLLLMHVAGGAGAIIYLLVAMFLTVAVPVWLLALYQATTPPADLAA